MTESFVAPDGRTIGYDGWMSFPEAGVRFEDDGAIHFDVVPARSIAEVEFTNPPRVRFRRIAPEPEPTPEPARPGRRWSRSRKIR